MCYKITLLLKRLLQVPRILPYDRKTLACHTTHTSLIPRLKRPENEASGAFVFIKDIFSLSHSPGAIPFHPRTSAVVP